MALVAVTASIAASDASERKIVIENMQFTPATAIAKAGDRITWVNQDLVAHTATANGAFDSGPIAPGHSWSAAKLKPGRYVVACTLHPTMKSTLLVE